jgi:hypothetical protein
MPQILAQRRHKILLIELTSGMGCAIAGAAFLAGSRTVREMSVFLFGWSVGCAAHFTQTVIINQIRRRKIRNDNHDGGT